MPQAQSLTVQVKGRQASLLVNNATMLRALLPR
jgi:hypothetical protein